MRLRRSSIHRIVTPNSQSDWLFVFPGLLLILLLGLPLMALFLRAAGQDFLGYALSETALAALRLSLFTSLISLSITLLIGTPLAYILARWEFPGRAVLELLLDLPVVLPPSVAGLALLIAFGRRGIFGAWLGAIGISLPFTTAAVIMAQTFVSAPLFVRSARIGFAGIDPPLEEAAHVEGATQLQMFTLVMFPLAGRALADPRRDPRHGQFPDAEPDGELLHAGTVRPGVLPQRADLPGRRAPKKDFSSFPSHAESGRHSFSGVIGEHRELFRRLYAD